MATQEQITQLRMKLGESIPQGGTASDTLFPDSQITLWIDNTSSINYAAVEGWEAKMAHWANLVNVVDGAAARELGDLIEHARLMIAHFNKQALGNARSRSRVGKIVR